MIEAVIQTVTIAQELSAMASLVDHEALATTQARTDLIQAESRKGFPPIRCRRSARPDMSSASPPNEHNVRR